MSCSIHFLQIPYFEAPPQGFLSETLLLSRLIGFVVNAGSLFDISRNADILDLRLLLANLTAVVNKFQVNAAPDGSK